MKTNNVLMIVVLFLGPYCFGQTSANQPTQETPKIDPGYSIVVTSPSEPFRLGSPINMAITITIGDKEIPWTAESNNAPYRAFRFLLTKDGREVETSVFHRKVTNRLRPDDPLVDPGGSSSHVFRIAPGTSYTSTIDLTKLYEITEPGTYTLNVSRIEADNKTIVRAKPVTFTIIP